MQYKLCRVRDNNFVYQENNTVYRCSYYNDIDETLVIAPSLFPNPTANYIYLRVADNLPLRTLKVYSPLGNLEKELSVEPTFKSEHRLDTSNLGFGVHYLQVIEASGKSTVLKFVVARN
jgi:hypothetical protein